MFYDCINLHVFFTFNLMTFHGLAIQINYNINIKKKSKASHNMKD